MPDHIHMMISIPPKHAVSQVVGFIKGKNAIHLAGVCAISWGRTSGPEGTTVGRDETVIREYIKKQEQEDSRWSK
jgi:putative transposase